MKMYRFYGYAVILLLLPLSGFVGSTVDLYNVRLSPGNINPDKIFLLVDKSDYRMYLYEDVTLRKIYKVVFGNKDQGDKLVEGDRKTPEGTFHIQNKRMDNRWSRFMLLDYPNDDSKQKFYQRQSDGSLSQSASMGGGIGIHGVEYGAGIRDNYVDSRVNWTLGCVSMKNGDVNELYEIVKVGTPVVIRR